MVLLFTVNELLPREQIQKETSTIWKLVGINVGFLDCFHH
jgi:hypothetical protein